MKKNKRKILLIFPIASLILVFLFINSCSNDLDLIFPEWDNNQVGQTTPLNADQRSRMEGIYSVEQGSDQFGSTVILQWTTKDKNYLSVYTGQNFGYFIMQGGRLDTTIYVQGFWRYQNSAETGLSQFRMTQGADYVLTGTDSSGITFTGTWGEGQGTPGNSVVFKFMRPIKPELLQNEYYIMNHHGSGGGPEYLPQTENTIEICKIIERYGANSIAIDIAISKDGIPFLFHDETLTLRLCQKGSLTGAPTNYTYKELYSFVRLIHGERIPTLEATLDAIITETTLKFVYIDCKAASYSSTSALSTAASIMQAALDKAESMNRDIQIYLAITSDDVQNAFLQLPNFQDIPSINELSPEDVLTTGSEVWSPRWTQGTQNSDVESLQAQGIQVICWTVDLPSIMQTYLFDGKFDGMMTNYNHLLAYYYYGQ